MEHYSKRIFWGIASLITMIAIAFPARAEFAEHALIVHRLSYWAPDYLTVTNNWNNLYFTNAHSTLKTLSVITEINGESTKDMEPQDFYSVLDNSDSFTLTYMTKIRGENKTFSQSFTKKKGYLAYEYKYYWVDFHSYRTKEAKWFFANKEKRGVHHVSYYGTPTYDYGPTPAECTSLFCDQNVDLFQYSTYDYMVAGDDLSIDLGIVQNFAKELDKKGLKYNADNPDLHIYFTKDANAKIESIYVPNIISETKSSSHTIGRLNIYYGNYSTWARGSSRTSGSSTTTSTDVGSTKVSVDADVNVQLALLDAHKMNNALPPVVWQMVYSRHQTEEFNLMENIKNLGIALHNYPFTKLSEYKGCEIKTLGLFFDNIKTNNVIISDISNECKLMSEGLQIGCKLSKIWLGKKSFKVNEWGGYWITKIKCDKTTFNMPTDMQYEYFFIEDKYLE